MSLNTSNAADPLSAEQRRAVMVLAQGGTIADAARAADRTERTIYRYLQEPHVTAALRAAEQEKIGELSRKLTGASDKALDVLIDVLDDPAGTYKAGAKLRAAALVLQHRAAFYELSELADRLAALEKRLEARGM